MAGFGEKRFWFSDLKKSHRFFPACFMGEDNVDESVTENLASETFHLGILFLESQLNKWLCASSLQECIVWGIDFP